MALPNDAKRRESKRVDDQMNLLLTGGARDRGFSSAVSVLPKIGSSSYFSEDVGMLPENDIKVLDSIGLLTHDLARRLHIRQTYETKEANEPPPSQNEAKKNTSGRSAGGDPASNRVSAPQRKNGVNLPPLSPPAAVSERSEKHVQAIQQALQPLRF